MRSGKWPPIDDLPCETFDCLDRVRAACRIIPWRLLWWTYMAREQPKAPCTTVLRSSEWAALPGAHTRRREPPPALVDLRTAVRRIAQFRAFSPDGGATANPASKRSGAVIGASRISPSCEKSCILRDKPLADHALRSLPKPRFRERGGVCRCPCQLTTT